MIRKDRRGGWDEWLDRLEGEIEGTRAADLLERIAYRVLDKARLRYGDNVVDLGAGHGLLAVKASRLVGPDGTVTAVDSDPGCLGRLSRDCDKMGIRNIVPLVGRNEDLSLESGKYDAVVCRSSVQYSEDLDAAVSEISRVLVPGGRFSLFEPLAGEIEWSVPEGGSYEAFLRLDRIISEKRPPRPPDRGILRRAFVARFGGAQSLVVNYRVEFEGAGPEEIAKDYLYDIPGEMAAYRVLGRLVTAADIESAVSAFARAAASGEVKGRMPCMFLWGVKTGSIIAQLGGIDEIDGPA